LHLYSPARTCAGSPTACELVQSKWGQRAVCKAQQRDKEEASIGRQRAKRN